MSDERPLPEPISRPAPPATIDAELAPAERYAAGSIAASTRRAYASDWRSFAGWCAQRSTPALPAAPVTVAAFLAAEADRGFRPVTVARRAAAIAAAHRAQNEPNPCDSAAVRRVLSGIRRTHGVAPERRATPLDLEPLRAVIQQLDHPALKDGQTLSGLRDRALILLGFAAVLRRSELVALDVEQLQFTPRGLLVTITRSKTDQDQAGQTVAVPYATASDRLCAVRAVRVWLQTAGIYRGAVFRRLRRGDHVAPDRLTGQSVALILKRRAHPAGRDPGQLSGHSLRSGYITAAAAAGVEERKIQNVSRHRNIGVLRSYVRTANAFDGVGEVL
jgi:integrase